MATDCPTCTRRTFLRGASAGTLAAAGTSFLPRVALAAEGVERDRDTLVCVFLRGGMDGLSAVAPVGDADYHDHRPRIAIPGDAAIDLDGTFGLHPALAPLHELYTDGSLAIVHAVGNVEPVRSHFEAMDLAERGVDGDSPVHTGWLARYLEEVSASDGSPFRAVGIGAMLPTSLRGYGSALALQSVAEFHVDAPAEDRDALENALDDLYADVADPLTGEAEAALAAIARLERSGAGDAVARNGAEYPGSPLGRSLRQVASLLQAGVGLEVACVDGGGWDLHESMGDVAGGRMTQQLDDLARSLAAFAQDLGDAFGDVTVVTMTEFGRRVTENGSGGTDHGRASAAFVLGGGIRGGQVVTDWPGLADDALEHPGARRDGRGDLRVTTDHRDVLAELLVARGGVDGTSLILPGHSAAPLGLARPR